jgi:hypothetical protein
MECLYPSAPPGVEITLPCYACNQAQTADPKCRHHSCLACHHFLNCHKLTTKAHQCYTPPCAATTREECSTQHPSHPTKDALLASEMKNNQLSNTKTADQMKEAKDSTERSNLIRQKLIEYKQQEDNGATEDLREQRTKTVTLKRQRSIEIFDDDEPLPQKQKTMQSVTQISPDAFMTMADIENEMKEAERYQRKLLFRRAQLMMADKEERISVAELQRKLDMFISSI